MIGTTADLSGARPVAAPLPGSGNPRDRANRSAPGRILVLAALVAIGAGLAAPVSGQGTAAPAPPQSEGEVALRQIAAPFGALRTFQATFVQTQSWIGMEDSVEYLGVLSIARPNRFRIEYSEPRGHIQVSDGTQVWTYVPENEQVLLVPLGEGHARGDFLTRILEESTPDPRLERGTLDGMTVRVLSLTPPGGLDLQRVRLWTREESNAILQYELTESGGSQTIYRLREIRENPPLDDRMFQFQPPPGVPVVELGGS